MQNDETDLSTCDIDDIRDDLLQDAEQDPSYNYVEGQMLDETYRRLSEFYPSHSSRLWFQFKEEWAPHLETFILEFRKITSTYPRCSVRVVDQSVSASKGYWFQIEWSWSHDKEMSREDSSALVKAAETLMHATKQTNEPAFPGGLYY